MPLDRNESLYVAVGGKGEDGKPCETTSAAVEAELWFLINIQATVRKASLALVAVGLAAYANAGRRLYEYLCRRWRIGLFKIDAF